MWTQLAVRPPGQPSPSRACAIVIPAVRVTPAMPNGHMSHGSRTPCGTAEMIASVLMVDDHLHVVHVVLHVGLDAAGLGCRR